MWYSFQTSLGQVKIDIAYKSLTLGVLLMMFLKQNRISYEKKNQLSASKETFDRNFVDIFQESNLLCSLCWWISDAYHALEISQRSHSQL